ncbi:MAG: aldo/keto reductase [Acidimicrobiales bacterium]
MGLGDAKTWGMGTYDEATTEATIRDAWDASIDAGATFFDTAEVYGDGESERIIGRLLAQDPDRAAKVQLATKFMPYPWKLNVRGSLLTSLRASLERLGRERGRPLPGARTDLAAGARRARRSHGRRSPARSGPCHRRVELLGARDPVLRRPARQAGLPLASNQIELSLLRRAPETTGLLATCAELGVAPAYSPLGQGRLTGKYSAPNPPPPSRNFANHPMEVVDQVVAELRRIGEPQGRSPDRWRWRGSSVKGAIPIPGAKNREQAPRERGRAGGRAGRRGGRGARRRPRHQGGRPRQTGPGSTARSSPTVSRVDAERAGVEVLACLPKGAREGVGAAQVRRAWTIGVVAGAGGVGVHLGLGLEDGTGADASDAPETLEVHGGTNQLWLLDEPNATYRLVDGDGKVVETQHLQADGSVKMPPSARPMRGRDGDAVHRSR